jgi:hypothetical protein
MKGIFAIDGILKIPPFKQPMHGNFAGGIEGCHAVSIRRCPQSFSTALTLFCDKIYKCVVGVRGFKVVFNDEPFKFGFQEHLRVGSQRVASVHSPDWLGERWRLICGAIVKL